MPVLQPDAHCQVAFNPLRSKKESNHNQLFIMAVALIVRKTRETGYLMKANLAVLELRCRAVNVTSMIVGNCPDIVKLYRLTIG